MYETISAKIADILPLVQSAILPQIQKSVSVTVEALSKDPNFSNYSFGCALWDNFCNRLQGNAPLWGDDIEIIRHGNESKIKIGALVFRHHRVQGKKFLPRGAKTLKNYVENMPEQMILPLLNDQKFKVCPENLVIAIIADQLSGLRAVFIGALIFNGNDYSWIIKNSVYSAMDETPSAGIYSFYPLPEEEIETPIVVLKDRKTTRTSSR
jgi:hypothetical protein